MRAAKFIHMLTEQNIHIRNSVLCRDIKQILCPTDLSPAFDEALHYAIALAAAECQLIKILFFDK